MSENDFLYALKENLPQDFSDSLREQLKQIELEEKIQEDTIEPKETRGAWWLLAVASIIVAIFGVIFFFANQPNLDVLNIAQQLPPTITNHGEINPQTISNLQRITALGDGFARRIRLSPDGETLAVESSAGLYLHDANNLNAEPRLIVVPENFGIIDYADDGTIYGVIFNYTQEETQQIIQIDPETSQITELFELPESYLSNFEISYDGSRLFVQVCSPDSGYCGEHNWTTQVYDTEAGTLALEFQAIYRPGYFPSPFSGYYESAMNDISQDGSQYVYLVRGDNGYVIHLMDIDTGQSQAILRLGTEGDFTATQWIQLSPDKQTLLISRHTQVHFWEIDRLIESDTLLSSKIDDPDRTTSMDTRLTTLFYPDERTLIGISDNLIHNYDITTGEGEAVFESDLAGVSLLNRLQINPEGDAIFALLSTGELVRYSYPDGMIEETSIRYDTAWEHQFFFRDGNLLTAGDSFSGTYIREWSLDSNTPSNEIFQPNGGIIYPIRPEIIMSSDGRFMNYSGQQVEESTSTFSWLHDLETGERHRMAVFFADKGGMITPDNRLIGLGTNLAYIYDVDNILDNENFNQDYTSFYLDDDYIVNWYSFLSDIQSLSLDGRMMATLPCLRYENGSTNTPCEIDIALWDIVNGNVSYTIEIENVEKSSAVGLSSDSQLLTVSTCTEIERGNTEDCSKVYFYNISDIPTNDSGDVLELDVEPIAILENLTHEVHTIRFHPTVFADGSRLVALSDNQSLTTFVKIYDDGTIEQLVTLPIQGAVTFNPDGNLVFANNRRGQIEIWGVSTGRPEPLAQNNSDDIAIRSREVITAQNLAQAEEILALGNGHAYHIALSPDDETLAIASNDGIHLHDAQNLHAEPQFIGSPSEGIRYLEYVDNGNLYVAGASDYGETLSLYRWDANSNQFVSLYSTNNMSDKVIQHIDISPDGSQLLIATCAGTNGVISVAPYMYCQSPAHVDIQIIDVNNPENIRAVSTQNTSNAVVAINPDWTQLAYYDNGSIYLYDMATDESQRVIEVVTSSDSIISTGLPHELWSLYFTPDGSELAFLGTANGDFELWSIDELNQVENDNPLVRREDVSNFPSTWTAILAFHPQTNDRLVSRSDSISVFSAEDASRLGEFRSTWQPRALELSSDGDLLYTLSSTGVIQVWEWSTRAQIDRNIDYTLGSNMSVSISEDSQFVVNSNNGNGDSMSFLWNTNTSNEDPQIPLTDNSSMQPVTMTAISPNNRYIAYEQGRQLYVYDREMNEQRQIDFVLSLIDLEFREDNSLVTLSLEGGAVLIKAYPPELLVTGDVSYPYDGIRIEDLVFSGSYSGHPSPYARLVTLSPNTNLIAVTHCNNIVSPFLEPVNCDERISSLVDTHTGEILTDLHSSLDFEGYHESLVFSADGNYIAMNYCTDTLAPSWACTENQGAIDIWHIADIQDGQLDPLVTIADIRYHQSEMSFIAYDDGSLLLEASDWEPVSGDIYETFTRFWSITADGTVTEIQRIQSNVIGFSPNGRLMIILEDGQIKLWAIPRDMSTVSSE